MYDVASLGATFSLHRCNEFQIGKKDLLKAALNDLGFRRFRLMSYWNIHETVRGKYDFRELDWQLDLIARFGGTASLCLGKRQPRWPECHMPAWAASLPKEQWYLALYDYISVVVQRYKEHPALVSWQLENEALLKEFGRCLDQDFNHQRLLNEYHLIKRLDPKHPVIMTLSDSWGLPWRKPRPDMYAMSLYRTTLNKHGEYAFDKRPPLFYKLRGNIIRTVWRRPIFIHELQAEPWVKRGILNTSLEDQFRFMTPETLQDNIDFARMTGLQPIDLWGLEWWYWLKEKHAYADYWHAVKKILKTPGE